MLVFSLRLDNMYNNVHDTYFIIIIYYTLLSCIKKTVEREKEIKAWSYQYQL